MTPANLDALADALAESMLRHEWPNSALVPFAEQDARIRQYWIGQAKAQIAGPLAPILAAKEAAEARAAQLQADVEALKGALKPFAEAAEAYGHSHDESQINERPAWAGKDYVEARLLAKHLRAARAATAREGQADA